MYLATKIYLCSMAGLYIHIPFCKQACRYCDFHFSTNQEQRTQLCKVIAKEIKFQNEYLDGERLETIYFGGGTPSILSASELEIIFSAIHANFTVASEAEITLEANPDDLTKEKLKELKQASVNRLSIGIQSFDDTTLKFFNRAHSSNQAIQCIEYAHEAGFNNLSLDLIYAVPGQEIGRWQKDVEQALALEPEHISAYSLTIEEKTAFGQWQKVGKIKPVDENGAARDFELLMDRLATKGYEHYEISNFCKPGFHSGHNSSYWKQRTYLGVGPSAHSFNGDSRQFNISNNHLYLKSMGEGSIPFEKEMLTRENKINEYIFTTLRTQWGCDLYYLKEQFDHDIKTNRSLQSFIDQQFLYLKDSTIVLTRKGKLLADQIASDLFVS
jgi:oxygen-independent coproporphyrinogen III oxidase